MTHSQAIIQYGPNTNVFAGIGPTPLVARSEAMVSVGERLLVQETISLHGYITGGCLGISDPMFNQFSHVLSLQATLLNAFGLDYQTLIIGDTDGGTPILTRNSVKVSSITFPNNNYASFDIFLPYTIVLTCYPPNSSSETFGARTYSNGSAWNVLNPLREVQYQDGEDGEVTITTTTSAKGIKTSSASAIANAETWVSQYDDWFPASMVTVYGDTSNACLRTENETINRYEGTYEIKKTYVLDQAGNGPGLTRYGSTYSFDINEGVSTIELQGTIEGCRDGSDGNIDVLIQKYEIFALQAPTFAIEILQAAANRSDLNFNPVSKTLTVDREKNRLSFSFTYNDDLRPLLSFDYKVNFDYDYENDIFTAAIDGSISSREPLNNYVGIDAYKTNTKWLNLEQFAAKQNLYAIVQGAFVVYCTNNNITAGDYPLGKIPISMTKSEDYNNFRLGLGASYKTVSSYMPDGFDRFDYTVTINPSLQQYKEFPCLDKNGQYQIFDLGYQTRATCSLQANGVVSGTDQVDGTAAAKAIQSQINLLSATNFVGTKKNLDSQQYNTASAEFYRSVSASASYSAEQAALKI